MGKTGNFTGIKVRVSDKTQPYRVWFKGNIAQFAKTESEAKRVLAGLKRHK